MTNATEARPAGAPAQAGGVPRPRPRPSLYHRTLRVFMRSFGMLSDGIRLGYKVGFNSGTMVDYVYRNKAHGITPLGMLIDRVMLNNVVWRGVRARRELLVKHARALLEEDPKRNLFDVAAGPGSYLFQLPVGDLWAGDMNPAEVERGRERTNREARPDIHFVQADAFAPATWPRPRFDILVASGFFDILDDLADVRRLIAAGTAATAPGAHWVFTVMEGHPDLLMLRDVLVDWDRKPWIAVTRSADEVLAVAEPLGWRAVRIDREPNGLFGVATMVRT
ncbi:MAG: class I SAM-dependent methyltransferase family protein [Candidatus Limnocylindrales bacterium]|jgi:hypothetical protein